MISQAPRTASKCSGSNGHPAVVVSQLQPVVAETISMPDSLKFGGWGAMHQASVIVRATAPAVIADLLQAYPVENAARSVNPLDRVGASYEFHLYVLQTNIGIGALAAKLPKGFELMGLSDWLMWGSAAPAHIDIFLKGDGNLFTAPRSGGAGAYRFIEGTTSGPPQRVPVTNADGTIGVKTLAPNRWFRRLSEDCTGGIGSSHSRKAYFGCRRLLVS